MYQTRIYNSVNHDIILFENPVNFTVNRRGQHFLTNPDAKSDRIIRQMKPLSVKTDLIPTNPMTSPGSCSQRPSEPGLRRFLITVTMTLSSSRLFMPGWHGSLS